MRKYIGSVYKVCQASGGDRGLCEILYILCYREEYLKIVVYSKILSVTYFMNDALLCQYPIIIHFYIKSDVIFFNVFLLSLTKG